MLTLPTHLPPAASMRRWISPRGFDSVPVMHKLFAAQRRRGQRLFWLAWRQPSHAELVEQGLRLTLLQIVTHRAGALFAEAMDRGQGNIDPSGCGCVAWRASDSGRRFSAPRLHR